MRIGNRKWGRRALMLMAGVLLAGGQVGRAESVTYPMNFDSAQQSLYYGSIPLQGGGSFNYFSSSTTSRPTVWQRFDLSLGTLNNITIEGKLNVFVEFSASDPDARSAADVSPRIRFLNNNGIIYGGSGAVFRPDVVTQTVSTNSGYANVLQTINMKIVLTHPGFADLANNPFGVPNNLRIPFIGPGTSEGYGDVVPSPYLSVDLNNLDNVGSGSITLIGTTDSEAPSTLSVTYDYTPAAIPEPSAAAGLSAILAATALRRRR
jgi:hypothetical protein